MRANPPIRNHISSTRSLKDLLLLVWKLSLIISRNLIMIFLLVIDKFLRLLLSFMIFHISSFVFFISAKMSFQVNPIIGDLRSPIQAARSYLLLNALVIAIGSIISGRSMSRSISIAETFISADFNSFNIGNRWVLDLTRITISLSVHSSFFCISSLV